MAGVVRSFDSVIDQIRATQFPHWRLFVREGYQDTLVGSTWENEAITTDESLRMLETLVNYYREDLATVFSVEMFKTVKSTGTGKTGKISFMVDPSQQPARSGRPDEAMHGLGGLGAVTQQFESRLNLEREMTVKILDHRDRENDLKRKEEILAERMANFEAEKAVTVAELLEKQKTYESRRAQLMGAIEGAGEKLIMGLITQAGGPANLMGLGAPAVEEPETPQRVVIESVAANVDAHITELEELKVWGVLTQKFIDDPRHAMFTYFRDVAANVKQTQQPTP